MQQFLEIFSELKHKKLYVTGESVRISAFGVVCLIPLTQIVQYAGQYVPCEFDHTSMGGGNSEHIVRYC